MREWIFFPDFYIFESGDEGSKYKIFVIYQSGMKGLGLTPY